jgi:phosphatidylinositol-3-phosphatase
MRISGFVRQLVVVACTALLISMGPASVADAAGLPAIHHVFIIMLENKDNDVTFGPTSPAPYLAQTLSAKGAYLQNYFGTGHVSLDNYISLVSGQAPNPATQYDCQKYVEFASSGMAADGQAIGQGCVYPTSVPNLTDGLAAKGLTWRSYNEDMGNNPAREAGTCGHPQLGSPDGTQKAEAPSAAAPQGDQYATRHVPFLYFHSVIDSPDCATHVVNFRELPRDLATYETTANLTFITPNLCDDGHDAPCVTRQPGGLVSANAWLSLWVPMILASPAYTRDGLLLILFDESEVEGKLVDGKLVMTGDATACCDEHSGPNTTLAGQIGPGGGNIGAVALSPFIKPGTVSRVPYNHYSTLKTIEDIFGLPHLGYSGSSGLAAFGDDVFGS